MAATARAARTASRPKGAAGGCAHREVDPAADGETLSASCPHSAFLAALAHDLRTPLNAMVGWLHLLTSGPISDELRERALAGIQRAVEQQRRVVATLDAPHESADEDRSDSHARESTRRGPPARSARRATRTHGANVDSTAAGAARAGRADTASDRGLLQGVFILAVDDDPDVLQMLQSLLEHSGAIVESTTSPEEALRRYPSWAGGEGDRLVLSDLAMHERYGISLMQAVRSLERERNLRRLPAIALSAHFRPDIRREAFEGGFDLFLAKPIDPSVLLNHLRSMLDR